MIDHSKRTRAQNLISWLVMLAYLPMAIGGVMSYVLCYRSNDHVAIEINLKGQANYNPASQLISKTMFSSLELTNDSCIDNHFPIGNSNKYIALRMNKYPQKQPLLTSFMFPALTIFAKKTDVNLPKILFTTKSFFESPNTTILLI